MSKYIKRLATNASGVAFSASEAKEVQSNLSGGICFASPSAVEGFSKVFDLNRSGLCKKLVPVAIGATNEAEVSTEPLFFEVSPPGS